MLIKLLGGVRTKRALEVRKSWEAYSRVPDAYVNSLGEDEEEARRWTRISVYLSSLSEKLDFFGLLRFPNVHLL